MSLGSHVDNGQRVPSLGPAQLSTNVQHGRGPSGEQVTLIILELRHSNGMTACAMTPEGAAEFARRLLAQASGLHVATSMPTDPDAPL